MLASLAKIILGPTAMRSISEQEDYKISHEAGLKKLQKSIRILVFLNPLHQSMRPVREPHALKSNVDISRLLKHHLAVVSRRRLACGTVDILRFVIVPHLL